MAAEGFLTGPAVETAFAAARGAPGITVVRCNPYGHGTMRGPRHLMGGLYGPQYEGPKKWECRAPMDGYWRMTCQCDPPHRGQRMPLCYAHVREIGRRQAGTCPPCVMPPAALALHEDIQRAQGRVYALYQAGADPAILQAAVTRHEDLSAAMTDLYVRGIIHRCPLILTEVS